MKQLLFLCSLSLFAVQSVAQPDSVKWTAPAPDHYSFIKYSSNTISRSSSLDSVFKKLHEIKRTHQGKINIIHIGDSHLQADMMTRVLRNGMHNSFGNAGRGIVYPQQLAGSNAPHDVHSSSNATWRATRLSKPESPIKTGICGFGMEASARDANVSMYIQNEAGIKDSFNRLVFFLGKAAATYTLTDSNLTSPAALTSIENADTPSLVFNTTDMLTGFNLRRTDADPSSDFCFYGVSLERSGSSGVLYHTIGVNGAQMDQYNNSQLFWQQLAALRGDFYIVSLGTNEAQNQHLSTETLFAIYRQFTDNIHRLSPNAVILFTTPPGSYLKGKKPNTALQTFTTALINYCDSSNIAFWDLYKISGGKNSAVGFKKNHLLAHDLVHFSEPGYRLQGQLLLAALATGYNAYVKAHPYVAHRSKPAKSSKLKTDTTPKPAKDNVKVKNKQMPAADDNSAAAPRSSRIKVKYDN
jgi:lysophospholipase L1-like esterase